MQYEDDYERRRAYVSRRRQQRRRQRTVRIILFFLLLGIIAAVCGIGGWYLLKGRGKGQALTTASADVPKNPGTSGPEANPSIPPVPESQTETAVPKDQALEALLKDAEALALTYDYDGAIALINASPELSGNPEAEKALASYEETKKTLVRADIGTVTHVFFHSLIMDNKKAFDGDADEKGYNQVMTTKTEFLRILEQMYDRGYVLVKMHDLAHEVTAEDGSKKMVPGDILLQRETRIADSLHR